MARLICHREEVSRLHLIVDCYCIVFILSFVKTIISFCLGLPKGFSLHNRSLLRDTSNRFNRSGNSTLPIGHSDITLATEVSLLETITVWSTNVWFTEFLIDRGFMLSQSRLNSNSRCCIKALLNAINMAKSHHLFEFLVEAPLY